MDNLSQLKTITQNLGYEVKEYSVEKGSELNALQISIDEYDETIILSVYPDDELDGSYFFQFYSEYTFNTYEYDKLQLLMKINETNQKLPLGNFNLITETGVILFKYIWAVDKKTPYREEHFVDVLDMVEYAITEFKQALFDVRN